MPQGQYPSVNAGTTYTASLIQSFAPLNAYKTADTGRTSTTTATADPDLSIPVVANAWYKWELWLNYEGFTQGSSDLKVGLGIPAGSTVRGSAEYTNASGGTVVEIYWTGGALQVGTNGAGAIRGFNSRGTLQMGGTAGSFTLNWAQNTSSGTATIVHTGSYMQL